MNLNHKDINTGSGLGPVKFGMSRETVKKLIGKASEIEHDAFEDEEDSQTETWHYDEFNLSLSFDEGFDWRLVSMAVTSDYFEFRNKKLIGLNRADLEKTLHDLKIADLEYEDLSTPEFPLHELVSSDALGINFWFEDGLLTEIQWTPLLRDEDDSIIWPK
ncbi:MAG: hypothetical protein KDC34_01050 [Saprospiraceae bacterium]|nr:hypothetical protein [Saprospiraceae bacterium]